MKEQHNHIFRQILEIRALSAIEFYVEGVLPSVTGEVDPALLKAILAENRLDEIYAICHERLAFYHEHQAKELRAFMARKSIK